MLLVKLGILAVLGKQFYTPFIVAHLYTHLTHSAKMKLRRIVK
jgi:hypothetical protein